MLIANQRALILLITQMSNDMNPGYEAKPPAMCGSEDSSQNVSHVKISEEVKADSPKMAPIAPKQLPFEFRALETFIESACRCLESEVVLTYFVHLYNCIYSYFYFILLRY